MPSRLFAETFLNVAPEVTTNIEPLYSLKVRPPDTQPPTG